ncbi:MAG: flagellar hook-length control protein FliK [Lachnospiraceae bacterium]|nr:flagellar hook-length control protein FliK [Lachnospiraceae bacterium]
MAISIDSLSNSDYNRIGNTQSTDAAGTSGRAASRQASGGELVGGSTISGQIIEKEGDQVTIRLANDSTISARLQGNADIEVGMRLTFEVAKGANDQTALRPLFSNLAGNNAAMSALRAAGLPINNTTLTMTDRMMTESMPVNKNALVDMFRNVSSHSNVSPESIVQMTKLNMPLTESNVIQFDNYRNFQHQITGDLQNVSDGIADIFNEAVVNSKTDVIKEVLDLIDTSSLETITVSKEGDAAATAAGAGPSGEAVPASGSETVNVEARLAAADTRILAQDGTAAGADSAGQPLSSDGANVITQEAVYNPELSLTAGEQLSLSSDLQNILILAGESADIHEPLDPSQIMTAVKELVNEYPPEVTQIEDAQLGAYSEEEYEAADEANANDAARADIAALKGNDTTQPSGTGRPSEAARPSETARTGANINNSSLPDLNAGVRNAADTARAAASAILDKDTDPEAAKSTISKKLGELLRSDGFTKLVRDSVKSQMSIKPQDVAENGKIEELYDRIRRTTAKVSDLMENLGRADSPVASSAAALSDNVSFMNQLNEFVNYIQLPLKMAGEDANGELYVYTNRKNLADRDGNYSALLHLDMEHLGPMDVYVTMRDHTKVSTNFYLESEEVLDFIESHIDLLTKRLTEKGYNTSTHVTKREAGETIGPIADEFTKEDANSRTPVIVSQMRFDVRA